MIVNLIFSRLKAIVLVLLAAFNRALCCFSRKRRNSYPDDCEVLQSVSVVNQNNGSRKSGENDRDWNSWDDSPRTVDEHIEQYRQKLVQAANKDKEVAPVEDFFQDMTPKIIAQTKVLLRTGTDEPNFKRLEANPANLVTAAGPELEDWEDEHQPAGWEELDDENTKSMIREKRREQRAHLHQQHQQQKSRSSHNQAFAERLGQRQS